MRNEKVDFLATPIEYLKGVGPERAKILKDEVQIFTFRDLLFYFPYKYIDRGKFYSLSEIRNISSAVQLKGVLSDLKEIPLRGRGKRLVAKFSDETGTVELVWFKGVKWIKEALKPNREYVLFGKPNVYKSKLNFPHPELELAEEFNKKKSDALRPLYLSSEKMKNKGLDSKGVSKIIKTLLSKINSVQIPEFLPEELIKKYRLSTRFFALTRIHFPMNINEQHLAERRLKFEELFILQLQIVKSKMNLSREKGHQFETKGKLLKKFLHEILEFDLTGAQKKVIKEIKENLMSGFQMNRLLQGDVGSGKTVVALATVLLGVENAFQTCLMAPTEILAQQHFKGIVEQTYSLGIKVEILTGSTKGQKRKEILNRLKNGDIDLLIGTHALIEDKVVFNNLGIAIIDEQHRFGVYQRSKLWRKNEIAPPHILVMTATPIPRTLAMTFYGDLDISIINELPPGRKPIKTVHRYDSNRLAVFSFVREEIKKGRQVYIIYPLIEESEKLDMKSLMDGYESICKSFQEHKISIVHGRMKAEIKAFEMNRFLNKETQIMISTTVIEVGVNVPNATVMVIENAERFGLSQLHQLRGRVGRGGDQSYCILMTNYNLSSNGKKRISTMVRTSDGFEIAEVDLKLRGPGDISGTKQSGDISSLKISNLAKDGIILEEARKSAIQILEKDPALTNISNNNLKAYLEKHFKKNDFWSKIS